MVKIDVSTTLAEAVDAFPQLAREFERRVGLLLRRWRTLGHVCTELGAGSGRHRGRALGRGNVVRVRGVDDDACRCPCRSSGGHPSPLPVGRDAEGDRAGRQDRGGPRRRHPSSSRSRRASGKCAADLEPHMLKEERMLFPMIRELATLTGAPLFRCGSLQNPISVMLTEHDAPASCSARLHRHRRLRTTGRRMRQLSGVLRRPGRVRGRHAPARPQGEQRAVPDGGHSARSTMVGLEPMTRVPSEGW